MTSNTVPIYRHGRKFYVSIEEYERIRSQERNHRRTASQKSQNLPIPKSPPTLLRSPSASLYKPIQRSNTNPYEYKYSTLRTPIVPVNSLSNSNNRSASTRLSRSTLKHYNNRDDLSSIPKLKRPATIRSSSSDKVIDIRRTTPQTSSSFHNDDQIKRSLSADVEQPSSSPRHQPKPKQQSRRPVATTVSDYGMSPVSTMSMTPTEHTYTQTNASKLTNYFARMQQSSLNPPSKSSPSAISGTGSIFETGMQGTDHVYTVLGSSNRRIGTGSSSLLTRSTSDSSKNAYSHQDTISGSLSDDNTSLLSMLFQRRNIRQSELIPETDNNYDQQRDLWTRSTIRSQSSDAEKKRVRFADMEGFTLETIPDKKHLRSPINTRLLARQQYIKLPNDSRGQPQPFHSTLYQATSKLATDV
jgi:hypothetical protein